MYESKTHVLSRLTKKEATNIVLFNIKEKYQHCLRPHFYNNIYRGHVGVVHYAVTRCSCSFSSVFRNKSKFIYVCTVYVCTVGRYLEYTRCYVN